MNSNDVLLLMGSAFRGAMDLLRDSVPRKDRQSTLALAILLNVERKPGISQGDLGRILRRDPMTMSQAVRALQSSGLLTSQPDQEDRRVKRLTLTKKGKNLGENLGTAENKLLTGLHREWGRSRLQQFARDLQEFNDFINQSVKKGRAAG